MNRKYLAALLVIVLTGYMQPSQGSFLDSITNGLNTATNAVSSGLGTASNAVSNGINTAVNATSNGLSVATNATANGLNVAVNATGGFINTAVSSVKDVYNVSQGTISNYTSGVTNSLAPTASSVGVTVGNLGNSLYNVTSGSYRGIVGYSSAAAPAPVIASASAPAPTPSTGIDATSAASIISGLTANSSGYVAVANSLLVALGQNKASGVESAIRNIINNQTGNFSYPATGINNTISLGLAEAVVTALVTAKNYTVTVEVNGTSNAVNASQVVSVFIAGLQDGVTPCARNVTNSSNISPGSNLYFENISTNCCYLVAQPLTYATSLAQSNGASNDITTGLGMSQLLGQSPSLDLTRCLTNSTSSISR